MILAHLCGGEAAVSLQSPSASAIIIASSDVEAQEPSIQCVYVIIS